MEWELAARYKDGSTWTSGNYASGATADYNNAAANKAVAWYYDNSNYPDSDTYSTQPVGGKAANSLGIKDMSGNVYEWCFDISGSSRVLRGGGWNIVASSLQLGMVFSFNPGNVYNYFGFRPVRTQ